MADQVASSEPIVGIALTQKQLSTIIDSLYYDDPDCGQSKKCVEIADKFVAIYADVFMKSNDQAADQVTSEPTVGIAMTQQQLLTIIDSLYYTDEISLNGDEENETADKLAAIYADLFMKPGDKSPFAKDVTIDDIPDM
jgi:hypothetical protein